MCRPTLSPDQVLTQLRQDVAGQVSDAPEEGGSESPTEGGSGGRTEGGADGPEEGGSDAREDTAGSPVGTPDAVAGPAAYSVGEAIAIVHLPSIGQVRPVKEGVALSILNEGVLGHYPLAAGPGDVGNFALAGHRTTYRRPLWDLHQMSPGDPVVVETDDYHAYTFGRTRVVTPEQTEVLAAVPDDPSAEPTQAPGWCSPPVTPSSAPPSA